jgi:hypothetical protein
MPILPNKEGQSAFVCLETILRGCPGMVPELLLPPRRRPVPAHTLYQAVTRSSRGELTGPAP